jgi:hypothetical protein
VFVSMGPVLLASSCCVSDVSNEMVGSGWVLLMPNMLVNLSTSSLLCWSLFISGIVFGLVGACSMVDITLSSAVNRSLSLGNGNGTLVGNHVMVSAILVPLVSGLYTW